MTIILNSCSVILLKSFLINSFAVGTSWSFFCGEFFHFLILGSPCGCSKLQSTSPVLSGVTCVGGRGRSQTQCLPPAHCWGHSQTGVYPTFPSPRVRTQYGVVWPLSGLLSRCQACGAALMGSGVLVRVEGRSARCTGAGGAGLACFVVGGLLQEGPCSTRREAGRLVEGMDPQKHSVGCLRGASKFGDGSWFPLEFRPRDGRGKWCSSACLFPHRAELCLQGLNASPSWCPLALPLSGKSC